MLILTRVVEKINFVGLLVVVDQVLLVLELLTKPFLELRDSLKSSELDDLLAPNNVISHLQAVFALLQFGKRRYCRFVTKKSKCFY